MSFLNDFNKQFDNFIIKQSEVVPSVPSDVMTWIEEVRPFAEGKKRVILPIWRDIYNDNFNNKMIVGGRQIFKSTYTTDILAFEATAKRNAQLVYVTYDDNNRTSFSRQKLQIGTFESNPLLRQFPRHKLGNVGEISLKNGSTIYVTTDHGQYHHVEGKSAEHVMLDESQYQEMENFERVRLTMTMTQGQLSVLGIGAEEGGAYHDLWLESDRREWIFDDPYWRDRLRYGWNIDVLTKARKWGLIQEDYLLDVCKGRWMADSSLMGHISWHGYHVPQEHFPQIPLTIEDAINKYKTDPTYSLEWKEKYLPYSLYITHVKGEFYHGVKHPITRAMLDACMKHHSDIDYLEPEQIAAIKDEFGDEVKIVLGVDFGSGKSSQTVIIIFIKYTIDEGTKTKAPVDKVRLVYYDPRPPEDQRDQAQMINKLFKDAKIDIGMGDLGYGAIQVKTIQTGGSDRITGEIFEGVGSSKFYGCRAHGDETKPLMDYIKDIDEHGETTEHIKIDKTTSIQEFIDFLNEVVVDPDHPFDESKRMPKLMIPNAKGAEIKNIQLIKDWINITRKDLPDDDNEDPDGRQKPRKEFNHPKDSLAAAVMAYKALNIGDRWNVVGTG